MSKNTNDTTSEESLAEDKSLETVRDILFGAQAREHDKRTQHLENLIKSSIEKLERDVDRKFTNIEKSIDKLQEKLAREAEATAKQVADKFSNVQNTIDALDHKTQSDIASLNDQTQAELSDLEKSAKNWNEDLAKQLELVHQQLSDTKVDRSALSELFGSLAVALVDDKA